MSQLNQTTLKQRIIFRRLIQTLIIIGIFLMAVTPIYHENDIFWQLKMGEEIWVKHHFPTTDPYSLPAHGEVWTLHEWLPALSFYLVNMQFGPAGLIIYKAAILAVTFGLFLWLFNLLKVNLYLSLPVFTLAALVNTRGVWLVFPSIFEYLFLVTTFALLELYRRKDRKLIIVTLMLLSWLWSNSHGSFFLLSATVGAYLLGDWLVLKLQQRWTSYQPAGMVFTFQQRCWLGSVLALSLLTPLFTPNGWMTYLYPLRITFGQFTPYVNEYQKFWNVWQGDWSDFVHGFTLILIGLLFLILLLAGKKLHPRDLLLGVIFTALALSAVRHVAVFALVALLIIGRYLGVWFGEYRGWFKRTLIKDILLLTLIISFVYFYKNRLAPFGLQLLEDDYPKAAAELIVNNRVEGNMFNHYNYGGYLIWKMPGYQVFIDGRLEMYEGQAGQDYLTVIWGKPGFEKLLDKYRINFFLIYLTDPIVEKLAQSDQWLYVYHDRQYVIFVKNDPRNREFLAKFYSADKESQFQKEYQAALAVFRADNFYQLGLINLRKEDPLTAIYYFQQALMQNPGLLPAHLQLARTYYLTGLLVEAKREYEFILNNYDPQNREVGEALRLIEKGLKK